MIADTQALRKKLDETINLYEYKMQRKPHLDSLASLLSSLGLITSEDPLRQALLPLLHFQPPRRHDP
jgi:20S proteasome alpha/beta subunit